MKEIDGNHPVSYATRILTELETTNSYTKFELLVVVSSVDYSENYVYGVKFGVIIKHCKVFQNQMKETTRFLAY